MARNQGTTNVNWGICTNTSGKADGTPCSKCQNKEKQAIRASKDFICEECGEPLTKTTPPTKTPVGGIIGAAVVLIGLGVGGYFFFSGNNDIDSGPNRDEIIADSLRQVAEQQRIADSIRLVEEQAAEEARLLAEQEEAEALRLAEEQQRIADSIRVADSIRIADSIEAAKKKTIQHNQPSSNSSNWNGVATYNGPMSGGQPNGIGGKLTFKSSYQLDLKDGNGSKLDIRAGETIENTKFENGKLRQGELHRKDGTRKWFNI